jgi:hypothetical protein
MCTLLNVFCCTLEQLPGIACGDLAYRECTVMQQLASLLTCLLQQRVVEALDQVRVLHVATQELGLVNGQVGALRQESCICVSEHPNTTSPSCCARRVACPCGTGVHADLHAAGLRAQVRQAAVVIGVDTLPALLRAVPAGIDWGLGPDVPAATPCLLPPSVSHALSAISPRCRRYPTFETHR